jgi:protein LTV1
MQHLRSVGSGGETYMVEAPTQSKQKGKGRSDGFALNEETAKRAAFELPEDALPSHPLDEVSYTAATSKGPESGLRPDLDPSIRQVLEALDDEAYAADDGNGTDDEDAFWDGVLAGGEVHDAEEQELWSDDEEEVDRTAKRVGKMQLEGEEDDEEEEEEEGGWGAVNRFKKHGKAAGASDDEDDEDYESEGGDTIADLKAASARRPQRRGAASAVGSAFSLSSSAMFRNDQLRHLDDRFDQVRLSPSYVLVCP